MTFLKRMGKDVIVGKTSVCHEDGATAVKIAVDQLAEGGKFIFEPAWLDATARYLLESRSYRETVWRELNPFFDLPLGEKSGRILWVAGNIKLASICDNERILTHKLFWQKVEVQLAKEVLERFGEEFCSLLDEGGSSRNLVGQEIKIF